MSAKLRFKCPHCGEVNNVLPNVSECPKCHRPVSLPPDGCIYLYRQGSPYGVAGGFGIYINGIPYGHIGNKELLCIPLPYGEYNLHCAVGMSRKCQDMQVVLSPQNRIAYAKVHIRPGFWANSFVIEPIDPKLLDI